MIGERQRIGQRAVAQAAAELKCLVVGVTAKPADRYANALLTLRQRSRAHFHVNVDVE